MKSSQYLVFVFFLLAGCLDQEVPLIRDYEDEWQLDVASKFITSPGLPVVKPITIDFKTTSDGSLLILLNKPSGSMTLGDYFLVKVSADGVITNSLDLPPGYAMIDIVDQGNAGYIFYMTNDYQSSDIKKIIVDENLSLNQSGFSFVRPVTFHTLEFSGVDLFLSQYESTFPGTRITRFNLEGQLLWTELYNSKYVRPFPVINDAQLLFYYQPHQDSIAVSTINAQTGTVQWSKVFSPAQVFGSNAVRNSYYRLIEDQFFLYGHSEDSERLYFSKINLSNGAIVFQKSSKLDKGSITSWSASVAEPTTDGGFLLLSRDESRTYLFKTDAAGTVGWKGDFVDQGMGRPVEAPNGDIYFVSDGYVFKLRAIRNSE